MSFPSDSTMTDVEEKTEVIYGDENIIRDTLEVYSVLTNSLDICNDSNGPSMFVIPNHPVTKAYRELRERGNNIQIYQSRHMILHGNVTKRILWSGFLFFLAGVYEIGGGYLVWLQ